MAWDTNGWRERIGPWLVWPLPMPRSGAEPRPRREEPRREASRREGARRPEPRRDEPRREEARREEARPTGAEDHGGRGRTYGSSTAPAATLAPPRHAARRAQADPERSWWGTPVIGTPVDEFEPRPPESVSYRPDLVVDGWASEDLIVRAASTRGYLHRYRGTPRQDDLAVAFEPRTGSVVFAVADGLSSARHGHVGSSAACRAAVTAMVSALEADPQAGRPLIDWQGLVDQAAWQLIAQARTLLGPDTEPAVAERDFATTLVAGMVRPTAQGTEVSLIQVGDSSAWILADGRYQCMLKSKYTADPEVVSSATAALPRTPRVTPRGGLLQPGEVLLIGTDGFGDPLGDGTGEVGRHFAEVLTRAPNPLSFAGSLDFSRETFDDDRTLIAIWPRTAKPAPRR
ncbi:protein phosphatase 2C domain-containing protein [Actinoplanes sp. DH11]|uniref:protein phosphatase 2C domain-containing protein n=1 Tax=Actinoplanes sp. DH11 TaxID=2857011 RepID=UPI001E2ED4A3|nr:protein phosphatase 2C domain-containing protein [Actinoplanes sp. DH11]